MLRRHDVLSLVAATAALTPPAGDALADEPARPATPASIDVELPGPYDSVRAKLTAAVRPPLVDDLIALARTEARLIDKRVRRGLRDDLETWAPSRLRGERRQMRREIRRVRAEIRRRRLAAARVPAASAAPGHLEAIAACESGGNPSAVDASGTYRGKYQFDMQTWQSVGGSGDPAAASEAEQDRRAAILYSRSGSTPWPVCGG
jgi:hypothetical protein